MRKLPQAEALEQKAWLDAREIETPGYGVHLGYELAEWEDSVWILHSEHLDLRGFDGEYHLNLEEGVPGFVAPSAEEWQRVRWSESAYRLGTTLGAKMNYPPSYHWSSRTGRPDNLIATEEGTLDEPSFVAFCDVVGLFSKPDELICYAFYGWLPANHEEVKANEYTITMFEGPLTEVFDLSRDNDRWSTTPSNFWPIDRSWFVHTNWDLSGTQVSGSAEFIAAIEANEYLETIRWERPASGDDNG